MLSPSLALVINQWHTHRSFNARLTNTSVNRMRAILSLTTMSFVSISSLLVTLVMILERSVATGTVTFTPSVSWIQASDVTSWLGIDVATANDTAFITVCVNATNNWCFRKRREAGYTDSMTTVPGADVKLGAIMYAATLYRERGSADSFASFDAMSSIPIPSTMGRIMSLIGCGRPQVA
jgi:hypothetical protein